MWVVRTEREIMLCNSKPLTLDRYQKEIISFKIINSTGQLIEETKPFSHKINLDITTAPDGIYFLEVTTAEGIFRTKFLKN